MSEQCDRLGSLHKLQAALTAAWASTNIVLASDGINVER